MDATRPRRFRDNARRSWYARWRSARFARHMGFSPSPAATELPLKDGYFEVTLPRAFFEGNPKSITLNWVDFYR
jgi:hypothetical protein